MGYFDKDPSEYNYRAFDIETTGFGAHDTLTTFTLEFDGEYHIWINTHKYASEWDNSQITSAVNTIEQESGESVTLYAASDSEELLESVGAFINSHFVETDILVAYNGETWNGGFDLQFLRTACIRNGVGWILDGVKYIDIYPVFEKKDRFNTEVPSHDGLNKDAMIEFAEWIGANITPDMKKGEISDAVMDTHYDFKQVYEWVDETARESVPTYNYNDQVGVYRALFSESHEYDPWADSGNAVTAFEDGEFVDLVLHNLADVVKTTELTDLVIQYVSEDDISLKTL